MLKKKNPTQKPPLQWDVCMHVCVRLCVCAYVRVCMRTCMHACVCMLELTDEGGEETGPPRENPKDELHKIPHTNAGKFKPPTET